ncbi:OmcA/MtrC family decaheme c-type cytochrome [Shewanella yunxiaonensis]|uniref:OmcA/MtrC family decaheme c-type cytochrome n=1 Tax=Shewanella yunxiaonensis TaxID=2829809 RepID=A0ABX7YXR8_9GAMM|nr:OmcA/MtrC family decaheme c-type cytochrome [Shewanella yunxiaonensis]QUN07126.1 OmcA/MtrC family decaheme c-type cytochrome [Shewanella yunxiaonensis]
MMNASNSKFALLLAAGALSMTLTGCGGSDGADGAAGSDGSAGGSPAMTIDALNFTFYDETITDGVASLRFQVTNQDDQAVVGLQKMRFYALQLLPQGATGVGNATQWQYIVDETCDLASTCPGTFVDKKNGVYTYTFSTNFADTSATRTTFNAELAQRFMIRAYNTPLPDGTAVPNSNAIVDFTVSGNEPGYSRKIVATASCNKCHGDVSTAHHSGSYNDVNMCASCHTPNRLSNSDDQFSMLIHAKHFTVDADGVPQPVYESEALKTCSTCHNDQGDLTPDWGNWSKVPTAQACGSCHSDIDFATGQGHSQQSDNSNCVACHNSEWTEEVHSTDYQNKEAVIAKRGMTATLVANDDDSATLTVTLIDANGNALDASSELSKIKRLETITNVGPEFPIMGYNVSPGSGVAHVTKDLITDNTLQSDVSIVDGKLVYTTPALPFGSGDTDTAFTFIGLEMCTSGADLIACTSDSDTTSMKAQLAFGTKSGDAPTYRHTDSVSFAACQKCHGDSFQLHKGHHTGFVLSDQLGREVNGEMTVGLDGCVACHTPDGTYASGANKGAFEMKLHVVHNEVGVITECTQCHTSFNLDSFKNKGALATAAGEYTTPITAVCTSCHALGSDGLHSQETLESYGAVVNGDYTAANQAAQSETCFYCHKPTAADHTVVNM